MKLPYEWRFFSYCDYHQSTDWAIGNVALSEFNECFIFSELNISPKTHNTLTIANEMAKLRQDYKFAFDVIDPLAGITQSNTTRSTIQDLNDYFSEFQKAGICTGAYFVPADTKSERGRLKIKERLRNSLICKEPFNNKAEDYRGNPDVINMDNEPYLPTLWVFANCKQVRLSLKNWREEKGKPSQAYSHHCTGLEFLMKDSKFRPPPLITERMPDRQKYRRFKGRR